MKIPDAEVSGRSKEFPSRIRHAGLFQIAAACLSLVFFAAAAPSSRSVPGGPEAKYLEALKKIYAEVKEMNRRPGENFVKGDFFIGSDDDDDTYKNDYVSILILFQDGKDKMKIQVTYMEASKGAPLVKIAQETKSVTCLAAATGVEVLYSDYKEKDLDKLADEILQAVVNKKKLLREGGIKLLPRSAV